MRTLTSWMSFGILLTGVTVASAQMTPGYSAAYTAVPASSWNRALPSPASSLTAPGTSLAPKLQTMGANLNQTGDLGTPMTIPQQGQVDLGTEDIAAYGGDCGDGSCGQDCCSTCCPHYGCCCGWFGGHYYMHLWRDDENFNLPLASTAAAPGVTILDVGDSRMQDASAGGLRIGKMLNGCWAVEGLYWESDPSDGYCEHTASGLGSPLNSRISFAGLEYDNLLGGGPQPVDTFFQNAQLLSLTRTFDYRNLELNFLRLPFLFGGNTCGRARIALLAGVRYFQAEESLEFLSDLNDEVVGNDPTNELSYVNEVENHLVGFQLGGILDYCITPRLSAQLGTKWGIYNNHQKQLQGVNSLPGGGGGAVISTGPDAGQFFGVENDKDDVAFLTEIDAGLAYSFCCNWRASAGYRVLAVSGYVDSANQIPYDFSSIESVAVIQDNNSLILHGLYAGLEYAW